MKKWFTLVDINKNHRVKTKLPIVGDKEGLELVSYQLASEHAGRKIKKKLGQVNLLEICCGIGGSTIFLAKYMRHIFAVDINFERIKAATVNAKTFGVLDRVTFIKGDGLNEKLLRQIVDSSKIEAAYTDVNWREDSSLDLKDQTPDIYKTRPPTSLLFEKINNLITQNIIMHLSKHSNRKQIRNLGPCEIENIKINGEIKFLNVYFGKLADIIGETIVSL